MPPNCKYALLLSSLPRHPQRLFSASQTPISRMQLDRRLLLLEAKDAVELQHIETLVYWSQLKNETDRNIIKKCRESMNLVTDSFVKKLVLWHLEVRTVLSALRLRHNGAQAPERNAFSGFGVWPGYIEQNWHLSDFGLGYRLPWVVEAEVLLANNRTYELEKFLLDLVWRHYARIGCQHYFDFSAVVIYVLRWELTHRWLNYNADKAMERFDKLVQAGLEGCALV
jgi:hypothetical protein